MFICFRVRQPAKPIRDGVKIFALCDAKTGYLFTFLVHDGRSVYPLSLSTRTASVVASLVAKLPATGHYVYMDNFFSTIALFRYIHSQQKQNVVGTVRINRVTRDLYLPNSAPHGTMKWRVTTSISNGIEEDAGLPPILAYSWKDCGVVYFLSTAHQPTLLPLTQPATVRRRSGRKVEDRPCPPMAGPYGDHMGGVDVSDQYRSTYTVRQKSRRWYMALFYWVVDNALTNAYICQSTAHGEHGQRCKKSSLDFRVAVATALAQSSLPEGLPALNTKTPRRRQRINSVEDLPPLRGIGSHYPKRSSRYLDCKICTLNGGRTQTNMICAKCGDFPLCFDCFEDFHESAKK